MSEATEEIPEFTEVAEQAKAGFDLKARLQGRALRTGRQTVYTDEETGEAHQSIELDIAAQNLYLSLDSKGEYSFPEAVREIAEEEISRLNALAEPLLAKLQESALTFNFRAVPNVVVKDARRRARAHLGLKSGQPISEDLRERHNDFFQNYLMAETITSYTDHASGETFKKLTIEESAALDDFLPVWEYAKLDAKLKDVQFKNVISESVTEDADF